jgi:hypothetical protein
MQRSSAILLFAVLIVTPLQCVSNAQVINVDIAPGDATNHFDPKTTLGAGIDRISMQGVEKMLTKPTLDKVFSSGWQPVSYRQNTELGAEAWHWNPQGTWSLPNERGYFTGSAEPTGFIRHSFGYRLPRSSSRMTDGDVATYWKSNPYLSARYTGEDDSLHPQWVTLDLAAFQNIDSIKIIWAAPFATRYSVQFWTGTDPFEFRTAGVWQAFPHGVVEDGRVVL